MLPHIDIDHISQLVQQITRSILNDEHHPNEFTLKEDGSLVTQTDLLINRKLQEALHHYYPHIPCLSEESPTEEQQEILDKQQPFWCLDPLDGTSNYASNIPFYCVSLALVDNGEPVAGVVYDPNLNETFTAIKGAGAKLNNQKISAQKENRPLKKAIALIDFKRLPTKMQTMLLQKKPFGSQRNFGACALEWCWLATNRGHAYLHGGQKIWDMAAGILIFEEAGGIACTLNGERVFNASLSPRSVIASPCHNLFECWKNELAKL